MGRGRRAAALAALLLAAACAGPRERVRRHQAQFDAYPAEVRAKILAGEAAVGFTEDMARLALGPPDLVYDRETADGRSVVWAYEEERRFPEFGAGACPVPGEPFCWVRPVCLPGERGWSVERLRLVFRDGKVSAVETLRK